LYNFTGPDGLTPNGLIRDATGNLYGTTTDGGGDGCGGIGCGVAYKLTPDGTETVLYRFRGGPDGQQPGKVIPDGRANLVGAAGGNPVFNAGVVFKVKP
jgi:hypothetical protein